MGQLFYGDSGEPIDIPDRLLAHLKIVITTKLRRRESFTLTWREPGNAGGRSALWLQEAIPLRFVFDNAEPEELDPTVLHDFATRAASSSGLLVDMAELPADLADLRRLASVA